MALIPISFYIPPKLWPNSIPKHPTINWSGFGLGIYAWTIQTYLWLRTAGIDCRLVNQCPENGIVFLHRNAFRQHQQGLQPLPKRLLVCFQGDLAPHPDAQVHVVQNSVQAVPQAGSYFIPHWPQPGLQPREAIRGDRFTTVSFFGHITNLAPEFSTPTWHEALQRLGLQWRPVINQNRWDEHTTLDTRWNDYRNVDVIVAARSFNPVTLKRNRQYCHKPATKLYNAWLAGVPAVLGLESSYQAERQSELDYLEAATFPQVLQVLERLKEDVALRQAMTHHGTVRAQTLTPEALTQRWQDFIQHTLLPAYDRWCGHRLWQQQLLIHRNHLSYGAQRIQQRWHDWRYSLMKG